MIAFRFNVEGHKQPNAHVEVKVYDALAQLHRAMRRHTKSIGLPPEPNHREAYGCCNCFERQVLTDDNEVVERHFHAIIRLWRGQMGSNTTTHEAVHAAWFFYWNQIAHSIERMDQEELLCYLTGEITGKMVGQLYAKGCYEDDNKPIEVDHEGY